MLHVLDVSEVVCPPDFPRYPVKVKHVDPAFTAAEKEVRTIPSDIHDAGSWFYLCSAECTVS
jgi:hypothetical protein